MKRVLSFFVTALLTLSLFAAPTPVSAETAKVSVIILFASGTEKNIESAAVASVGGEVTRVYSIISAVAAHVPATAVNGLKRNPLVLSVDPDVAMKALDSGADQQISANDVWTQGYYGSGVRLAILDSGIATSHREFAGRIVACKTEVAGTTTCEDDQGHGTHVAGIAGAQGIDGGAKGVAPSVLLMSDKVLDSSGSGSLSQTIAGIDWAVANDAQIISMSLSTSPADSEGTTRNCDTVHPSLTTAINNAVAAGVTVVAGAGNSGASGLGAPGCISSVIAVGAVDSTDTVAGWSGRGAALQDHGVAAPGVGIYSAYLNGGYTTFSGTSMATPMVSGTIALMLSKNPNLTPSSIHSILFSNSDCVSGTCPNTNIGYGRVNTLKAVNNTPIPSSYTLSFQGYDYDNKGEVSVLVNNQVAANLPSADSPQNNNLFVSYSLNISKYIVPGTNTLTFKQNIYSSGVQSVKIISDPNRVIYSNTTYYYIQQETSGSVTYKFITSGSSPPPSTGTLSVTTTPVNGEIFVDSISWGTAPVSKSIVAGSHIVSFGAVSGYTTPPSLTVSVTAGQTTSVTGTYTPSSSPTGQYALSFQGYDYDNKGEVSILVNNQLVASMPTVESSQNNNVFRGFFVDISTYVVTGTNTLTFKQNLYSSGVKDVRVTSSGSTIYSNATQYDIWVGSGSRSSVTYKFNIGTTPPPPPPPPPTTSYTITWDGYDYDSKQEVTVTLNGQVIGSLPSTTTSANNDVWTSFSITTDKMQSASSNTLTYTQNLYSSKIRNLVIKDSNGNTVFSSADQRSLWLPSKPSTTYIVSLP